MNKRIFYYKPIRYLCPVCKQWHDWIWDKPIGEGWSNGEARLQCTKRYYYTSLYINSEKEVLVFDTMRCIEHRYELRIPFQDFVVVPEEAKVIVSYPISKEIKKRRSCDYGCLGYIRSMCFTPLSIAEFNTGFQFSQNDFKYWFDSTKHEEDLKKREHKLIEWEQDLIRREQALKK